MNQLFQQLNQSSKGQSQTNPLINTLKQKYQQCMMMTNPIGYIQNMPEMKNVLNAVQQSGGNAQQLFYKLAESKGVDPDSILNMFK